MLQNRQTSRIRQSQKHAQKLKAVALMGLDERQAVLTTLQLEELPIYQKVRHFIKKRSFRNTSYCLPLNEAQIAHGAADAAIPWEEFAEEIGLIREIGRDVFEKYFLQENNGHTIAEIASVCGITAEAVQKINTMLIRLDAVNCAPLAAPVGQDYSCIAQIQNDHGKLRIEWTLSYLARGLYEVDHEKLDRFAASALYQEEKMELRKMLDTLAFLNFRANRLHQVLELILHAQEKFLKTSAERLKAVLTARSAALTMGIHPSTLCRLIAGRSIRAPQGRKLPLAECFPSRKTVAVAILRHLNDGRKTDDELAQILRHDYGINLSRRAVNAYRNLK